MNLFYSNISKRNSTDPIEERNSTDPIDEATKKRKERDVYVHGVKLKPESGHLNFVRFSK